MLAALAVAGCGGGGGGSSSLALGEEAVVQHADTGDADATPTTLGVTVLAVRQGTQQELEDGGFTLDPDEQELTPYYVDASFENQGTQTIDRRLRPGLEDGDGNLINATTIISLGGPPFEKCTQPTDGQLEPARLTRAARSSSSRKDASPTVPASCPPCPARRRTSCTGTRARKAERMSVLRRHPLSLAAFVVGFLLAGAAGAVEAAPGAPFRHRSASVLRESATLSGGESVAVSGEGRTAVVGTLGERGPGAALIFSRTGSQWRLLARLTPSGKTDGAKFGSSVGISGNGRTVLVGAPGTDDGKGAAWVFSIQGGGVTVGSRLRIGGISGKSGAGTSVSLSADGRNAIVGGPGDNKETGAVWFFRKSGTAWRQTGGKVTASDAKGKSRFGSSVAIGYEGDSAVVGGPGDFRDRGAVWIWVRSGSAWKRQATIRQSFNEGTKFGSRVSLSADGYTAIVGSPSSKTFMADKRPGGSAWILRRSGSSWKTSLLGASLGASLEPRHIQYFGRSVAMAPDGLTAVVGGGLANRYDVLIGGGAWIAKGRGGSWGAGDPIEGTSSSFGTYVAVSYRADVVAVGSSGRVTVFTPTPLATKVAPAVGPAGGGTEVTLTGVNFVNVRGVTFGSTPAAVFTVVSPTTIRATSPPGAPGSVHVRVTNSYGTSPELPGGFGGPSTRFTYVAAPTITGVSPGSGPPTGGTQVTITGTGLFSPSAVQFGGTAAASFTVRSSTEITAVSPPGSAGTVSVTVTTPYGTSAPSDAARFTYISPATVVGFDNITTGGPGQVLVPVTAQYAGQGVTFNSPSAIDYSKGAAIPGFARSGTVAIEHCVGVEFCTTPIRATFSAPQRLVRVYVGFSFQLNQPLQVQLRALNAQRPSSARPLRRCLFARRRRRSAFRSKSPSASRPSPRSRCSSPAATTVPLPWTT